MADVEQKLQAIGQPTEGISTAVVFLYDGGNLGMDDGPLDIFAKEFSEPSHTLATDNVVRINSFIQVPDKADVPAYHDYGLGLIITYEPANLLHFFEVWLNRTDSDDIVGSLSELLDETIQGRVIDQGTRNCDVRLDQHQSAATMEHPKGEDTLNSRHLIMVQFHGVDHPAAVLIVLCIRSKDACQEDLCPRAKRVDFLAFKTDWVVSVTKLHLTL
jgi:hypothetical protein